MLEQLRNNNIDLSDRVWLNIKEGVKMVIMNYVAPLSMLGDVLLEVDWSDISKYDPNW